MKKKIDDVETLQALELANEADPENERTFHILTTSAGAISPDTNADELVIETGTGGISIFSAVAGWGNIFFGDSDDDDIGKIQYNHNDNSISFTANAAKYLVIESSGVLSSEVPAGASKTNMNFRNGGVQKGSIVTSDYSNNTTYNTTSDYRLKENINYDWDATTRLKQLKPARFNFKANPDLTMDGFIAHEVSDVVSIAVTGEKDAMTTDDDGNAVIVPQGIDQSKLVPLLVKTIQELEARITILENP